MEKENKMRQKCMKCRKLGPALDRCLLVHHIFLINVLGYLGKCEKNKRLKRPLNMVEIL